jgi:5-formyltetrahydrofolate cyclo-ligase
MKDKVRKELIVLRRNLSKDEVFEKSNKIKSRLFKMKEFKESLTILFYVSYDNEVYTHEMIKDCIKNKKNVVVPVTDKKNKKLILSKLENWDDLSLGAYNILKPKKEKIKEISIDDLDLIIVPGVGFDESGHRIGHGKGYYDNLLKNSVSQILGLAFEFQIIKYIPIEKHDITIDKIITEKRIITCKKSK